MDLLRALESEARSRRRRGTLDRWLEGRGRLHAPLSRFDDVGSLLRFARGSASSARDPVLACLCAEATVRYVGDVQDEDASALLLWVLMPGLVGCHREFEAWNALPVDDLDAELISGLWSSAREVTATTSNVWAYLVNGARWAALDAIRRSVSWERRVDLADATSLAHLAPPACLAWHPAKVLIEAVRRRVITVDEVPLLILQLDEARNSGNPRATKRQQFLARRRLREWIATFGEVPPADLLA